MVERQETRGNQGLSDGQAVPFFLGKGRVDDKMETKSKRKLEIGNLGEMKRVYELDVYKLAEELSDMVWHDFNKWNKKVRNTLGYQII